MNCQNSYIYIIYYTSRKNIVDLKTGYLKKIILDIYRCQTDYIKLLKSSRMIEHFERFSVIACASSVVDRDTI
jgi:hypothetical protein